MAYPKLPTKSYLPLHKHIRRTSPNRRVWKRSVPRAVKLLICALLAALLFTPLPYKLQALRDESRRRQSTIFPKAHDALHPPEVPIRQRREPYIDDRYLFTKYLGEGAEGKVDIYADTATGDQVVIKTFHNVARDLLPAELARSFAGLTTTWPSEIEAGARLGSLLPPDETGYVPMLDYFILRTPSSWQWATVMPLMTGGTLIDLASTTKLQDRTPHELDAVFRPAFNNLLTSLASLHDQGLCHDDMKADNIFLATDQSVWLLGDLSNVRQTEHPWHGTRTWRYRNQWKDCKINDVRRALKSYLWFLREAAGEKVLFDRDFYAEREAWSRLYWQFIGWPAEVEGTLAISEALHPGIDVPEESHETLESGFVDKEARTDAVRAIAVSRELICTSVQNRLWTWWKLGGFWPKYRLEMPLRA